FGFWLLGMTVYLFPRLLNVSGWYSAALNSWHYWLTALGTLIMFLDLLVAGVVQGYLWRDLAPWEASLVASMRFWLLRSISATMIIIGQFLFFYNAYKTWRLARRAPASSPSPVSPGLQPVTT